MQRRCGWRVPTRQWGADDGKLGVGQSRLLVLPYLEFARNFCVFNQLSPKLFAVICRSRGAIKSGRTSDGFSAPRAKTNDPQTQIRPVSVVLAEEEPAYGTPPKSGHLCHTRGCGEARARGAVFQIQVIALRLAQAIATSCPLSISGDRPTSRCGAMLAHRSRK